MDCAAPAKEPDPDDAPLDQNVKNLECGGIAYRVVREEKPKFRPGIMNTIEPSRAAARSALARSIQKDKMTKKK